MTTIDINLLIAAAFTCLASLMLDSQHLYTGIMAGAIALIELITAIRCLCQDDE